ncbi:MULTISPECIES: hypothetical protein [Pantoea]|jgi:cell division protein FtsB|uniref:hypothetical protein n=1 Tax=Pantoea TaxID=53335 RepID=UPI00076AE81F|nr:MULTISPECIES: hypothetical protein [Pantoea]AMG56150.1 hypothetical protein AL522_00125 [Pantoea vagans]
MSEETDGVKEGSAEFFKGLAGRFAGPCAAYITTSWLAYNWSNIIFLFMSKAPVEKRITAIYGQDNLYYNYLVLPVLTGIALSITMPGLNALISNFTAYFKAKIHYADEKAIDREEIAKKIRENKKKEIDAKIETLEAEKKALATEITDLQSKSYDLKASISAQNLKILALALRTNRFINDYSVFYDNDGDIDERSIKATELFNLFSQQERSLADDWLKHLRGLFNSKELDAHINQVSLVDFTSIDKIEEILMTTTKMKNNQP